ncbi:MAG: hypothetical protein IPN42_05835 [Methylococcaceae bacterium]|nr:hypothetical protein [Methylococcaceae bacterium]
MKFVSIALVVGLILLYFVIAALKIDLFNWEMLIHSGIRFFTGFIILGIGYFYEHKIQLKISIYLVLGLFLADDVLDYFRNTTRFSIELILYGIYMLLWGASVGYLFIIFIKSKNSGNF